MRIVIEVDGEKVTVNGPDAAPGAPAGPVPNPVEAPPGPPPRSAVGAREEARSDECRCRAVWTGRGVGVIDANGGGAKVAGPYARHEGREEARSTLALVGALGQPLQRQRGARGSAGADVVSVVMMASAAQTPSAGFAGYADLPGVRLWYTDSGDSGVPVILLHANTGNADSWQYNIPGFVEAGYRVITFDRRGWGRSRANPGSGPQPGTIANDLHALVEHLGLDRFHLVGVAGGGFAAYDYVLWHPERLRSMTVAASGGAIIDEELRQLRQKRASRVYELATGVSGSEHGVHGDQPRGS